MIETFVTINAPDIIPEKFNIVYKLTALKLWEFMNKNYNCLMTLMNNFLTQKSVYRNFFKVYKKFSGAIVKRYKICTCIPSETLLQNNIVFFSKNNQQTS